MLTLPPRAARSVYLPHFGRQKGASDAGRWGGRATLHRERPPLWILLPAVLVASFELLPLLYLVGRTLDAGESGWSTLFRSRTFQVVVNTAALAGAVAVSTIAIAVPL